MELVKDKWEIEDIEKLNTYLESKKQDDKKIEWSRKIVNTKLVLYAIKTDDLRNISKLILKGNYQSYLDLKNFKTHEAVFIYALIINKINDIKVKDKYLKIYINYMESWSHVDTLDFKVTPTNEDYYLSLSRKLFSSENDFIRRLSIFIIFKSIRDKRYLKYAFNILLESKNEKSYYPIMMLAWLLCECFIRYYDETYNFAINNIQVLNHEMLNKAISKSNDSFRLSISQKNEIKELKMKKEKKEKQQ